VTATATVVVVSWNGAHLLPRCLESLRRQTYPASAMRVVVVDNASTDGTAELVTRDFPEVTLLRAPSNLGFAGGNNLALGGIQDDYAVLVNNDAVVAATFVASLIGAMEQPGWQRVGAATARVLLDGRFVQAPQGWRRSDAEPGSVVLVNSTGNIVDRHGYGKDRDWLAVDDGAVAAEEEVFGFCGAAAILRRTALAEVGHFDDRFFLYYEDTDLSWRLRLAGWEVRYVADALAWHEHAASSGEGSPLFRFHNDRNRLLTLVKDAPAGLALGQVLRFPFTALSIRLFDDDGMFGTRLRAMASFVRLLPHAVRQRHRWSTWARRAAAGLLVP
jgi:hypothetical protein